MAQKELTFIEFVIRSSWHRISRLYNQMATLNNCTMSVGFILMIVEKEGTPSTKLGPRMGMEPTSLSRTLFNMEEEGLIRRGISKEDKRKVLIFLTEKGLDMRRKVKAFLIEFNESCQSNIKSSDLKGFFSVMNSIDRTIDHFENELTT